MQLNYRTVSTSLQQKPEIIKLPLLSFMYLSNGSQNKIGSNQMTVLRRYTNEFHIKGILKETYALLPTQHEPASNFEANQNLVLLEQKQSQMFNQNKFKICRWASYIITKYIYIYIQRERERVNYFLHNFIDLINYL